jgi:hypothetical protein
MYNKKYASCEPERTHELMENLNDALLSTPSSRAHERERRLLDPGS